MYRRGLLHDHFILEERACSTYLPASWVGSNLTRYVFQHLMAYNYILPLLLYRLYDIFIKECEVLFLSVHTLTNQLTD
jgi:hypothetical protein